MSIDQLKANNRAWSQGKRLIDPQFFSRLEAQQSPHYLWIGCSDSRVPANEIVGLDPGELFVHRNIANLAPPQDTNYLSVLQYAVAVLRVRHVLVVGHYGCGGIRAAMEDKRHGLLDHWLQPIRNMIELHAGELDVLTDSHAREDRVVELNVIRQVRSVAADVFVRDAWKQGQGLAVHGWVYSLKNGLVTDLGVTIASLADYAAHTERVNG